MKISIQVLIFVTLATIVGFVASAIISFSIMQTKMQGSYTQWRELPDSPSRINEIMGAAPGEVYVNTNDGYFVCDLQKGEACWSKFDGPIQTYDDPNLCGGRLEDIKVMSLPINIIDTEKSMVCEIESVEYQMYALSEDRKLFVWDYSDFAYSNIIILFGGTLIGGTACLVISISAVFILRKLKNKGQFP